MIRAEEFAGLFGVRDVKGVEKYLPGFGRINTSYRQADLGEFQEYLLSVLKRINQPYILRSRSENLKAFENGWQENLALLASGCLPSTALKPKYFRPNKFMRFKGGLIVSPNRHLEYDLFTAARQLIFRRYLRPYRTIYELGCGSFQNLVLLSEIFPEKDLRGLDWTQASTSIARLLAAKYHKKITGRCFDMTRPGSRLSFLPESAVITIHALEQLGTDFQKLVKALIRARPGLVLHYEPIAEFYKPGNCLDQLALVYSRKRNYLCGFFDYLRERERAGQIEILQARRPYVGGIIHEASLIIWRPRGRHDKK
jgi:SAM-dependent methyltransferase